MGCPECGRDHSTVREDYAPAGTMVHARQCLHMQAAWGVLSAHPCNHKRDLLAALVTMVGEACRSDVRHQSAMIHEHTPVWTTVHTTLDSIRRLEDNIVQSGGQCQPSPVITTGTFWPLVTSSMGINQRPQWPVVQLAMALLCGPGCLARLVRVAFCARNSGHGSLGSLELVCSHCFVPKPPLCSPRLTWLLFVVAHRGE